MNRHMEKKRFDELGLQGREVECPACEYEFDLSFFDTVGGGYGVVGVKCPHCGMLFGIDGGATKDDSV